MAVYSFKNRQCYGTVDFCIGIYHFSLIHENTSSHYQYNPSQTAPPLPHSIHSSSSKTITAVIMSSETMNFSFSKILITTPALYFSHFNSMTKSSSSSSFFCRIRPPAPPMTASRLVPDNAHPFRSHGMHRKITIRQVRIKSGRYSEGLNEEKSAVCRCSATKEILM